MLSDEEKEAIDHIKESPTYRELILLRVFEKQSKEIEELKTKERLIKTYKGNLPENVEFICLCKNDFERNISDDYISKDKIKEKIKELEKLNEEATGIGYGFAIYYLQSFLKEE